jgi:hypothetical protein
MPKCVFNYFTNNCNNIYYFTDLKNGYYKVTKKILKFIKISDFKYKKRYVPTKINGKKSIQILKSSYQDFIINITSDNTYYNRNIPIKPSVI